MDYPIHIDANMDLSILYLKGLAIQISIKWWIPEDCFYLKANSADPDEMPPDVAFYHGCTVFQSICLPVSRMKRLIFIL